MKEDLGNRLAPPVAHRPIALENLRDRLCVPGVVPPFAGRLSGLGDHRRQQDELRHAGARSHERAGEGTERLGDDHELGVARHRAGRRHRRDRWVARR